MFKRFYPRTPDPYLGNNQDASIAKLGHINALIDYINDVPPGSGIESVTGDLVDNSIPLNPVVNTPTLQQVSDSGGLTNSSTIREGTIDHGYGGGISRLCANNKDDQWEDGVRYIIHDTGGFKTVIHVENSNNVIPDSSYDQTLSYAVGSRFKNLVSGIEYICTQANEGDAIWLPLQGDITILNGATTLIVDEVIIEAAEVSKLVYTINGNVVTIFLNVIVDFAPDTVNQNGWFTPIAIPETEINDNGIIGSGSFFLGSNVSSSVIYPIMLYDNKAYMEFNGTPGSTYRSISATITYSYILDIK